MGTPLVLVAEDDDDLRELLQLTLEHEGFQVRSVAQGDDVLPACTLHAPALLLLDLSLPGANGVEVTRRVRATPELAELPILVVSGLGLDDGVDHVLAAGANDYLPKPFRPADLVLRVTLLLSQVRP